MTTTRAPIFDQLPPPAKRGRKPKPNPVYTEAELMLMAEPWAGPVVYLIHFDTPVPAYTDPKTGQQRTIGHYMGTTADLPTRIHQHKTTTWQPYDDGQRRPARKPGKKPNQGSKRGRTIGDGATVIGFVNSLGVTWRLARVWDGASYADEKRLKAYRNSALLCPICQAAKTQLTSK